MSNRLFVRFLIRCALKCVVFTAVVIVVLNPDLKRAVQQVAHTLWPETLIQPGLASMSAINRDIDRLMVQNRWTNEVRAVEKFIRKKIRYVTDYENWMNVEYWPTAEETWQRQQEDCDGRAVLAASILRARGFSTANLVVGLQHMWVQVDENEKRPGLPKQIVGILNPEKRVQIEIAQEGGHDHYWHLGRALLQPTALRDTSLGLIGDIPVIRRTILMLALLLILYLPSRDARGLLSVIVVGLVSAHLLSQPDGLNSQVLTLTGAALFLIACLGAIILGRRGVPDSEATRLSRLTTQTIG